MWINVSADVTYSTSLFYHFVSLIHIISHEKKNYLYFISMYVCLCVCSLSMFPNVMKRITPTEIKCTLYQLILQSVWTNLAPAVWGTWACLSWAVVTILWNFFLFFGSLGYRFKAHQIGEISIYEGHIWLIENFSSLLTIPCYQYCLRETLAMRDANNSADVILRVVRGGLRYKGSGSRNWASLPPDTEVWHLSNTPIL